MIAFSQYQPSFHLLNKKISVALEGLRLLLNFADRTAQLQAVVGDKVFLVGRFVKDEVKLGALEDVLGKP